MRTIRYMLLLGAFVLSFPSLGDTIRLPADTIVFGELDQFVTSKKKAGFAVGDEIRAKVWRPVVVEGRAVLKSGLPMVLRIAEIKPSRFVGLKGKLGLEALSVEAADGTTVLLDGGYNHAGKGRVALSASLAALVAWPTLFIKGQQAELPPGTVFDAAVQTDAKIDIAATEAVTMPAPDPAALKAEVLYNVIERSKKLKSVPLRLEWCGDTAEAASVVTINGESIETIALEVGDTSVATGCSTMSANAPIKALNKHFGKGINRFEVETAGQRTEVVLLIEF